MGLEALIQALRLSEYFFFSMIWGVSDFLSSLAAGSDGFTSALAAAWPGAASEGFSSPLSALAASGAGASLVASEEVSPVSGVGVSSFLTGSSRARSSFLGSWVSLIGNSQVLRVKK